MTTLVDPAEVAALFVVETLAAEALKGVIAVIAVSIKRNTAMVNTWMTRFCTRKLLFMVKRNGYLANSGNGASQ
ncbi:hypothetical protein ccbrp13_07250 [Ktedonobacteria bacterium brp13]|nr:hypothetical protein ccbrp13_07250 [Ktedonobacteria bacterium brp13]